MMNLLRRRALMIAAQQNTVPVWDGVTVTTPALVDGYYEIYDGATLAGFNALAVDNKKGRLTADFALNENFENFESWETTPPTNLWQGSSTSPYIISEIDGQGHSIYGLYIYNSTSSNTMHFLFSNMPTRNIHHLRIKNYFIVRNGYYGDPQWLTGNMCEYGSDSIFHHIELKGNFKAQTSSQHDHYGMIGRYLNSNGPINENNFHSIIVKGKMIANHACGGLFGWASNQSDILRNMGFIGTVQSISGAEYYYSSGILADGNTSTTLNNVFCSSFILSSVGYTLPLAQNECIFTKAYSDHTKYPSGVQGTPMTTVEMQTQAYVDELNANIAADPTLSNCCRWKLDTDNYPTLDF